MLPASACARWRPSVASRGGPDGAGAGGERRIGVLTAGVGSGQRWSRGVTGTASTERVQADGEGRRRGRGGRPARWRGLVEAVRGGRGRVGDGGGVDYGGEVEAARSPGGGGAAHSDGADVQGRRACCPFPIQIGSGKRGEGEGEPERRRRGGRRGEGADAREGIGRGEILSPARCVRACLCVCVVWWRRVRETRGKWGGGSLGFGRPRGL